MLPLNLRISLIICIILYFILIFYFLKKKSISLKYTLLWLLAGVIFIVLVFFPQILIWLVHLAGIVDNMNGLFIIIIGLQLVLLMSITAIVSKQTERIRTLVQQQAIMEKRIRELEEKSK